MRNKLLRIGLLHFMAAAQNVYPTRYNRAPVFQASFQLIIDRVINDLVNKGICILFNNEEFAQLYPVLPGKLRGQVLFHCDLKSKKIFITYIKVNRK